MRNAWIVIALVCYGDFSIAASVSGFLPTEQECHEGSDFIKNAALSRDNGYSGERLVQQFDDDIMVLSGMDPQKRWFVRSPGATQFLRQALADVFAVRRKPKDGAAVFLRSCMAHVLTPDDL